jgi:hypothetical protein
MKTKRLGAARIVAARLFAAEDALDQAAVRIAELTAAMPTARLDARLSALIGQTAFASSTDALSLVARAREQIVTTHVRLKAASDEIGLGTISYGDSLKAPEGPAEPAPHGLLRIAS